MSHSLPATPDQGGARIMSLLAPAVPSIDKIKSTARKEVAEPSPASTYGDSAEESTAPATPEDHMNGIIGLPIDVDGLVKATSSVELDAVKVASTSDHGPLSATSISSGHAKVEHTSTSAKSSPRKSLTVKIPGNGTWHVRADGSRAPGGEDNGDDPFVGNTTPTYRPRPDRPNNTITNNTAQAYYGTEACIFVANLAQYVDDEQLTHAVTRVFARFGTVFVKVRRDRRGMPFAFLQYETVLNAKRAIQEGRGLAIHGRPCRTEAGKCNRALYLSRISGDEVTEAEARQILRQCGEVSSIWHASDTDREMYRLPEGIWVRFDLFDDCRDAKAIFRNNPDFRLEDPRMVDDGRTYHGARNTRVVPAYYANASWIHGTGPSSSRWPQSSSPPMSAAKLTTPCSIFIGNLPENVSKADLENLFRTYGVIQAINIVRRLSNFAGGVPNVFAFLEYHSPEEAEAAVAAPLITFGGQQLRVERKEIKVMSPTASTGSPMQMSLQAGQAYQRGLAAGMQAAQVQPTTPSMMPPYYPGPYEPYYSPLPYGFDHHAYNHGGFASPMAPPQYNNMTAQPMMSYAPYPQGPDMASNGYAPAPPAN